MNLMPNLSFHRSILTMSLALARPRLSTNFWPSTRSAFLVLSGLFLVGCSGCDGSTSGCRCSRIDAIRHVLELKTGGLEVRR